MAGEKQQKPLFTWGSSHFLTHRHIKGSVTEFLAMANLQNLLFFPQCQHFTLYSDYFITKDCLVPEQNIPFCEL